MKTARIANDTARGRKTRAGQVLVIFAASLILLVLICAITVDVGRIVLSHAELQDAVDAAALAGASQLDGFVGQAEKNAATAEALALAECNRVAGDGLTLGEGDITFGRYLPGMSPSFKPESAMGPGEIVDSIQVRGRRQPGAPDGPVGLFFASIFGLHASAQAVRAVATQPRRYVMFVMDRSGSMCFDTTGVTHRYSPNSNGSMIKSPNGWYWMSRQIYRDGAWRTAYFYARNDATGAIETSFLPAHIRAQLVSGTYFRYICRDEPSTVQSGWLYCPTNLTIYSRYGSGYPNWSADAYGPVSSCDYAVATQPVQPMQSSKDASCAFIDLLNANRDRAGLVTYAWEATLEHSLTDDWDALKNTITAYDPRGATATPEGMESANDEFILSGHALGYGQRVMLLLTDGMANTIDHVYYNNPSSKVTVDFFGQDVNCYIYQQVATRIEQQTERAMENGIRVYTVSFGDGADQDIMPLIASKANGAYYYAADHENLTDIFVDIFYKLPPILTQ